MYFAVEREKKKKKICPLNIGIDKHLLEHLTELYEHKKCTLTILFLFVFLSGYSRVRRNQAYISITK